MKKYLLLTVFSSLLFNTGFSQDPFVSIESQFAIGSSLIDNAVHTVIDSEGNRIVYGTFGEEVDFDPGVTEFIIEPLGSPDIFLASYSNDGSLNWAFNLGRIGLDDGMAAHGLGVDSENNVIISGGFSLTVDFDPSALTTNLTAVQGQDGFVAKYDPMAQLVWVKQFGGVGSDGISALAIDDQDNNLIGVRFGGEIDLDPSDEGENLVTPVGGLDAAVVKLDADGIFDWSYLVAPAANNEAVSALAIGANGDVAMGALVNGVTTGIPVQSMLAGVLDSEGVEQWAYDFQNQGQANMISHIAFSENQASIYLGGRIQEDTDFDPSDNEEIISPLFADPFVSKHSASDGSLAWAKYVESSSTADYCAGVHESSGAVFLAGSFDVLATFVPGDFGTQIPSNGASDVFVSVYDAESGDFVEAESFGGMGGERANDAFFAGAEGMVLVGQFNSSLGLVEGESIDAEGFEDAFLAEFSYVFDLSADNELNEQNINLYPVPAADQVFLQLKDIKSNSVEIKLINIIGQTMFEEQYNDPTQKIKLDISDLNQGVYLVEIKVNGSSVTKRLIKQ